MPPTARSRSWPARLLLLGTSLVLALAIAEASLRWVFHAAPLLDIDIYYLDAARNLRMRPGSTRRHVTRQWDVAININQEGFRDRIDPIASPEPPILALGDSFAFGWGVNLDQTYLYLLEEQLCRRRPTRLVKSGTPGTGPGDQFRLLEAIAELYKPRLVILSFFVGNDFTDVQMGGLEQFEVQDGLLIRRSLVASSWTTAARQKLLRTSHLLQFLRAEQLAHRQRRAPSHQQPHAGLAAGDPWLLEFAKVHLKQYPEETARGVARTFEYLDAFDQYCRRRGADFLLLVIPRSYQVYPEELAELQSAFSIAGQDLDLDRPQRLLGEWARSRSVALLDLRPEFRRRRDVAPDEKLYYYPDAHLNQAGHRVTAELMGAFLEQKSWPGQPPRTTLER